MIGYYEKTALIIGAGAHVPYGYPTGEQLRQDFCNLWKHAKRPAVPDSSKYNTIYRYYKAILRQPGLTSSNFSVNLPESANNPQKALTYFLKIFCDSRFPTIDTFLSRYDSGNKERNYAIHLLGKSTILATLIYYEQLESYNHKMDWIEYILNEFLNTPEEIEYFFKHPPKIITFNYDNHLERALYNRLRASTGLCHSKAINKLKELNVLHIYGETKTLNDGDNITPERKIENLKVIGEERNDKEEISKKTHEILSNVNEAFFLGYGFDTTNNNLLFSKFKEKDKVPEFYSTNMFSYKEEKRIIEQLPVKLQNKGAKLGDVDCLRLIEEDKPIFSNSSKEDTVWRWPDINTNDLHKKFISGVHSNFTHQW